MKAEKLLSALAVLLALAICAMLGVILWWSLDNDLRADRLYAAGDYSSARVFYARAKNEKGIELCDEMILENRYLDARRVLQNGNYEMARVLLAELGDYKDSANLLKTCEAMEAAALAASGDVERALEHYEALGDFPGSQRAVAEMAAALYDRAAELASAFEIDRACRIWGALGDYRDSSILLKRGEAMKKQLADPMRVRIDDPSHRIAGELHSRVYEWEDAYFVLPEKADADTHFLLYYPGGRDEELYIEYFTAYLKAPAPDTVAVFLRKNGLPDTQRMAPRAAELLDQAAADCGVFPREVMVVGSSLGVYPALHSLLVLQREFALSVPCCLALDAGNDWKETDLLLSRAQCRALAGLGTELYLFESPWVGMDRPAIRDLVNTGNRVWLVGCERDEHAQITFDAMSNGVIAWAQGDRTKPCPIPYYTISRFEPDE